MEFIYFIFEFNCRKDGYLFDKEAILQYIITKKTDYAKKLKEFERQKQSDQNEENEANALEQQKKLLKFINTEKNIVTGLFVYDSVLYDPSVFFTNLCKFADGPSTSAGTSSISNMANGHEKKLPSFWLPSQSPAAKKTKIEKPDSTIYCPISQKPLKAKDLIDVKFTLVQDPDDKKSLIAKENRYMCAVTHDILSNSVPCAILRPT